ncbi:SDR family NAD(P)-dependent oxidoreductase [Devosia sp.]|uniref:SDR family NAD(P)-dependent oxidoreductase n=1 Tax=Devosia sp. TaxID=1871048 RepID=UPI002F1E521C
MTGLHDRVIIVTGAGRGIGAATAHQLAQAGAQVVVTARALPAAHGVAGAIAAAGGAATALACDVADYDAVARLVGEVDARFGRIDALVNNAGTIEPIGPIADADPAAWAGSVQINLVGAYHMVRAVLPVMLRGGAGTIVNLSSGAAFRPLQGWSAYCAAKAGLAMLTRSIDHEYASRGIRAIGLSPGVVDTGMQATIRASGINPVSQLPRTALAAAEEPAKMIAWLCGPAGAAHAGKEIDIREPALRAAAGLQPLER